MSDATALKVYLMLAFALAKLQEVLVMAVPQEILEHDLALAVTSHDIFENLPPFEKLSPNLTPEDIYVRKHAEVSEADSRANGVIFTAVDALGELSPMRRHDLGGDEKLVMAVTSVASVEELPPSEEFYPDVIAEDTNPVRRHATIGEADVLASAIPFGAVVASDELPAVRRQDLGIDNMDMEAPAETDAPKGEPRADVENADVAKKQEAMVEASLDQQGACADISGTYSEEMYGRESTGTVHVVTGGGCAFKFDDDVDIAVSGNIAVLMGARREFSGAIDGGKIIYNNGVVWSKHPKGSSVPGPL